MTDADLEALGAAARAATPGPGPWHNDIKNDLIETIPGVIITDRSTFAVALRDEDANFIARANPIIVMEMIDELRQLRAIQQNLRTAIIDSINFGDLK